MPKKYTFEKKYKEAEETNLFRELNKIKEQGVIIYQKDVSHTGVEYGILMKEPDPGCFLELTYFMRDNTNKKIRAVVTSIYDTKPNDTQPKVVEDLEKILRKVQK